MWFHQNNLVCLVKLRLEINVTFLHCLEYGDYNSFWIRQWCVCVSDQHWCNFLRLEWFWDWNILLRHLSNWEYCMLTLDLFRLGMWMVVLLSILLQFNLSFSFKGQLLKKNQQLDLVFWYVRVIFVDFLLKE